ncbi:FAD:protein FMN transferase [Hydrogenophilus thiooxidans]|uniref:FAD:protein FMN transferase n=1 Tax=Hydrogenophilus thiooxidans TaxID=2820326 RepID=UPI001C227564|nr:FAD:protein FMN transferase [Hydrogenophilus thiooxidans]
MPVPARSAALRRVVTPLVWLSLLFALAACSREPTLVREEQFVFGTRVELTVVDADAEHAHGVLAEISRELARLHRTYHAWEPSPLTRLNAAIAAGHPARVSAELAAILSDAQQFVRASDGLFDPGIGALVALWGFHRSDFSANQPPDPAAIAALRNRKPTLAALTITPLTPDPASPCAQPDAVDAIAANETPAACVTSSNPAVAIDLGGYLKGYALDRAAEIVRRHAITAALINIGGNILALGQPNATRPWRIALQHPRRAEPLAVLPLYDGEAIGTSGDYQRYFLADGQRYHHLIDPRTGWPAPVNQAFTVVIPSRPDHRTGLLSDVVSKPLFLAGDDWPRYAARFGVRLALRVAADGALTVTAPLNQRLRWIDPPDALIVVDPPEPLYELSD